MRPVLRICATAKGAYASGSDSRLLKPRRNLGPGLIAATGAGDGIRTRDINLGKVALYQLSYSRLEGLRDILR